MAAASVFVSKRLQRPAVVLLCLVLLQMLTILASCDGERYPTPMAVRAAIGHR